ncbi:MAG: hypothetical protein ABI857_00170 [Acidobacteriota bacterium]
MKSRIVAGVVAGIIAGVVFGMMMTMMSAPTPEGGSMPMMGMVAMVVGSTSLVVGWLYHLFNSVVIGAIFGGALGGRAGSYGSGIGLGAVYGFVWWILGGLILMPMMLGMPMFAPLMMAPMRMIAMASLVGHLIFGVILGGAYVMLFRRSSDASPAD